MDGKKISLVIALTHFFIRVLLLRYFFFITNEKKSKIMQVVVRIWKWQRVSALLFCASAQELLKCVIVVCYCAKDNNNDTRYDCANIHIILSKAIFICLSCLLLSLGVFVWGFYRQLWRKRNFFLLLLHPMRLSFTLSVPQPHHQRNISKSILNNWFAYGMCSWRAYLRWKMNIVAENEKMLIKFFKYSGSWAGLSLN